MSFAATSHTQRTSSTSLLRSDRVGASALPEETAAKLTLVCREGVAEMDITDEAKSSVEDDSDLDEVGKQGFPPEEHTSES